MLIIKVRSVHSVWWLYYVIQHISLSCCRDDWFPVINIDILSLTSDCDPRIDLSQILRTLSVFDWISSRASDCLGWKIILVLRQRFFQIVKRLKTMSRKKQRADSK